MNQYERARTATFEKELACEKDIQDLGDRVGQPIGIGARRGELDAVSVHIKERNSDGSDGFKSAFQSRVSRVDDVEAVVQRVVNTVAIAFENGDIRSVKVNVSELCASSDSTSAEVKDDE